MNFTVQIPESYADRYLADLRRKLTDLRLEADAVQRMVSELESQRAVGSGSSMPQPVVNQDKDSPGKPKRKKGENLKAVTELLQLVGDLGHTNANIAKHTGLPVSSVNAVLNRYPNTFTKTETGLWKLKAES